MSPLDLDYPLWNEEVIDPDGGYTEEEILEMMNEDKKYWDEIALLLEIQ